jgi:hypothetical protein
LAHGCNNYGYQHEYAPIFSWGLHCASLGDTLRLKTEMVNEDEPDH